MPKRSSIKKDINQTASDIVMTTTKSVVVDASKNQAAVALGRLGGLKGGKARAKSLSPEQRRKIAAKAAAARWAVSQR